MEFLSRGETMDSTFILRKSVCVCIYIVLHNINGIIRFYMFQLFVCIKSLKSFKIIELYPKEGTPQEVNVIFLLGLMSLFLSLRGGSRT